MYPASCLAKELRCCYLVHVQSSCESSRLGVCPASDDDCECRQGIRDYLEVIGKSPALSLFLVMGMVIWLYSFAMPSSCIW
jgi:hypothetical protein